MCVWTFGFHPVSGFSSISDRQSQWDRFMCCLHIKVNSTNFPVCIIKGGVCFTGWWCSISRFFQLTEWRISFSLFLFLWGWQSCQHLFDGRERQKLFSVSLVYCWFVFKIRLFFCLFFNLHPRLPLSISLYSSFLYFSCFLKQSMLLCVCVCVCVQCRTCTRAAIWVICNMHLETEHAPTISPNL